MNVILEFKGKIDIKKITNMSFDEDTNTLYFRYDNKTMEAVVKKTIGSYIAVINEEHYVCDNTANVKRCFRQQKQI